MFKHGPVAHLGGFSAGAAPTGIIGLGLLLQIRLMPLLAFAVNIALQLPQVLVGLVLVDAQRCRV